MEPSEVAKFLIERLDGKNPRSLANVIAEVRKNHEVSTTLCLEAAVYMARELDYLTYEYDGVIEIRAM